jgi:hypothetical protein
MMKRNILYLFGLLLLIACGGGDDSGGGSSTGGSEYLNVSDIDIPGGNTTATLQVNASNNCDWVVSSSDSWIRSINPTKGRGSQNVTLTVQVNPSSSASRTAIVTVKNTSGTITRNVAVTQAPNAEQLTVAPASMNFTADGGTQEIVVTSNTHWSVKGKPSWMSLSKTEWDDSYSVVVTVETNTSTEARDATLIFTGTSTTAQVTIHQAAKEIVFSVTPNSLTASAKASTVQFIISGNANWAIGSNREWAKPDAMSGQGERTVKVSLEDNTTEVERKAEITVTPTGKSPVVVTITQTPGSRPDVTILQVTDVTRTEATVTYTASATDFSILEQGVCYSTTAEPTVESGTVVQNFTGTVTLTGLTSGAEYHVRAYAKNAVGISYSEEKTFTTSKGETPNPGDNPQPGW